MRLLRSPFLNFAPLVSLRARSCPSRGSAPRLLRWNGGAHARRRSLCYAQKNKGTQNLGKEWYLATASSSEGLSAAGLLSPSALPAYTANEITLESATEPNKHTGSGLLRRGGAFGTSLEAAVVRLAESSALNPTRKSCNATPKRSSPSSNLDTHECMQLNSNGQVELHV